MSKNILIVTGDAGEGYEEPVVAAPSKRRLHLVIHECWDTYLEKPGYGLESDLCFDDVDPAAYDAILILRGGAAEYLRSNAKQVLVAAGLLKGPKRTPSFTDWSSVAWREGPHATRS